MKPHAVIEWQGSIAIAQLDASGEQLFGEVVATADDLQRALLIARLLDEHARESADA